MCVVVARARNVVQQEGTAAKARLTDTDHCEVAYVDYSTPHRTNDNVN